MAGLKPLNLLTLLFYIHIHTYIYVHLQQPAEFTNMTCPSTSDTSHVPCKFFRQGACQAGAACPFSHDLGTAAETICKYFAKVRMETRIQT